MSKTTTRQRHGTCLCGAVRVQAEKADDNMSACHCGMCRRWGGGPLLAVRCGTEVAFEGEEFIAVFASSAWAERGFCRTCGTLLFFRRKADGRYSMPAGLFGDGEGLTMERQIFTDNKPAYYTFANVTREMTEAEVIAMYGVGKG